MQTTVTLPVFAVLAIFLGGVGVGWIMSKFPIGGNVSIAFAPSDPSAPKLQISKNFVRKVVLKCQCGALWNFQEGTGPLASGGAPLPGDDSFVCPKCGRSIDLKLERQAEADLLRNLNLRGQS